MVDSLSHRASISLNEIKLDFVSCSSGQGSMASINTHRFVGVLPCGGSPPAVIVRRTLSVALISQDLEFFPPPVKARNGA